MIRRSHRVLSASAVAVALGSLSVLPASASPATAARATFCGDASSLTQVPVLALPSSTDFFTLLASLDTLTRDQNILRHDVTVLNTLSSLAPTTTLKSWYGSASASASNEIGELQTVQSKATILLNGDYSNDTIMSVASAASAAASHAAIANTYLTVAAPDASYACAHWPGLTPPKPVVKPKPKHKHH
jgi:hypothetical protein